MKKIILYSLLVFALLFASSSLFTGKVLFDLKNLKLENIETNTKRAILFPKVFNKITFNKIPAAVIWEQGLLIITDSKELESNFKNYLAFNFDENIEKEETKKVARNIISNLEKINQKLNKINFQTKKSFLIKNYFEKNLEIKKAFEEIVSLSNTSVVLSQKFLAKENNYLIVLQNTDEVRATGGFMGSFTHLIIKDGILEPFVIQDIYVPDGQYHFYREAPPGLKEYLSSGKGMRLPDANWYPELSLSAREILSFFKEIENKNYDGVIFLNLDLIESLLAQTEGIYLHDYEETVTNENFSKLARADRKNFFPGSQEKSNFLNTFMKAFETELIKMTATAPEKLSTAIGQSLIEKDIQFYSNDKTVQDFFEEAQLAGTINNPKNSKYFYLIESNIGINKANKAVSREVNLKFSNQNNQIKINYQNNNPENYVATQNPYLQEADHLSYINYQRIYTNPEYQISSIKIDGQEITDYQEKIFETLEKEKFKEIAFVVAVFEQSQTAVEINLTSNDAKLNSQRTVLLQKQSGIPTSKYFIKFQEQLREINLNKDLTLSFE